jgi:hypothetical protein
MTVRQVAADYPACREVLRHGEPEEPFVTGDYEVQPRSIVVLMR